MCGWLSTGTEARCSTRKGPDPDKLTDTRDRCFAFGKDVEVPSELEPLYALGPAAFTTPCGLRS
jgi:hypothetical protein